MAKQSQGKFDVAGRLGANKPVAVASPDDILFKPAAPPPAATAVPEPVASPGLLRFGSQIPAGDLIMLHRMAYWQRVPLYQVLSEAIRLYGSTQPEAASPLPEKERAARKLPQA